jgi:trehalose 6-phosphate phosphatase
MKLQVEEKLSKLSEKAMLAIISGRSMADIKTVLDGFKPRYIIGNHGIERDFESNYKFEISSALSQNWLQQLVDEHKIFNYDGVELENKMFSLTLHYRKAKDASLAERKIKNILARLSPPPRIVTGKYVLNIVPENAPHKGLALLDLMESRHYSKAIYIGDDDTDEDVFDLEDDRIFTVRVGQKKTQRLLIT